MISMVLNPFILKLCFIHPELGICVSWLFHQLLQRLLHVARCHSPRLQQIGHSHRLVTRAAKMQEMLQASEALRHRIVTLVLGVCYVGEAWGLGQVDRQWVLGMVVSYSGRTMEERGFQQRKHLSKGIQNSGEYPRGKGDEGVAS